MNQQQIQKYVQHVLKALESNPETLTKEERRLARKYQGEQQRLGALTQDLSQLRDQIRQAEARVRSIELQAADSQGKASGYLEYMASMKFEPDDDVVEPTRRGPRPVPKDTEAPMAEASPEPQKEGAAS